MSAELTGVLHVVQAALYYFIAGIFVIAAFHKLADTKKFNKVLNDYQILPVSLVKLVAPILPIIELGIASLLCSIVLFGELSIVGVLASIILLSVYTAALVKVYLEGKTLEDCGCGGSANQAVSLWPITRNLILISICVVLLFSAQVAADSFANFTLIICLAIALSLIYWTVEGLYKNNYFIASLEKHYD